jgi:hypothetical protein
MPAPISVATAMTTTIPKPTAEERPTYVLQLRPEPGVDPVRALRAVLKVALRRYGLRCVSAHKNTEVQQP